MPKLPRETTAARGMTTPIQAEIIRAQSKTNDAEKPTDRER
jgi:hypothetical protein